MSYKDDLKEMKDAIDAYMEHSEAQLRNYAEAYHKLLTWTEDVLERVVEISTSGIKGFSTEQYGAMMLKAVGRNVEKLKNDMISRFHELIPDPHEHPFRILPAEDDSSED